MVKIHDANYLSFFSSYMVKNQNIKTQKLILKTFQPETDCLIKTCSEMGRFFHFSNIKSIIDMNQTQLKPMVGAVAIVRKGDYVLLGLRCGKHASGVWGFPGGHVEFGEHPYDTVVRECKEETNLDIQITDNPDAAWSSNVWAAEAKHYVTVYINCTLKGDSELINMEPDKFKEWKWIHKDRLPDNLMFDLMHNLIKGTK